MFLELLAKLYICFELPPFTRTKTILSGNLIFTFHSTKNIKTMLRTFPRVSRVSQSKYEANRSRGFRVMIGQTNKQTPKQRLQLRLPKCHFYIPPFNGSHCIIIIIIIFIKIIGKKIAECNQFKIDLIYLLFPKWYYFYCSLYFNILPLYLLCRLFDC